MSEKFKETKVTRPLLYILTQKGYLDKTTLENSFQDAEIYPSKKLWQYSLDGFLLSLGIVFMLCGVIFFFAYNWAIVPKFVKLGLVQSGIIILTLLVFTRKKNDLLTKIGLTAACVLVGATFAVFGQIYQTGANAYDFFLWWTILISAWVLAADFLPLWAIYIFLVNMTIILYVGQVLGHWFHAYMLNILFLINAGVVFIWEFIRYQRSISYQHRWFGRLVMVGALSVILLVVEVGIWDHFGESGQVLGAVLMLIFLSLGIYVYAYKIHDIFALSMIYLCLIAVGSTIIYEAMGGLDTYLETAFVCAIFSISATALTVIHLIRLSKKWQQKQVNIIS